MSESSRVILGLREAGWNDTKINNFILYVETGDKSYLEKVKEDKS